MTLKIFTDGGSINNPGRAASAFVFLLNDKRILTYRQTIGIATNNFAEYYAVLLALTEFRQRKTAGISEIHLYSDSKLLVNQLNGLFKVKNSDIRNFILKIRVLEQEIKIPVIYKNIPREENYFADSLVKKELYSS